MNLPQFVWTILVASTLFIVGVVVNQSLVGATLAILVCFVMMALNLHRGTKFRAWTSHPLSMPPDDLKEYYRPAKNLHDSIRNSRDRTRSLISTSKKYRNIANRLPDAVVILTERKIIESINSSATTLLGLKLTDIGKPLATLIRHPDAQLLLQTDTDDVVWGEIPAPVNSNIRLELRLFHVSEQETMLMARDISDTSRLLAVRQDFIANVSHELRTPLTVLMGYIESVFNDELDRSTLLEIVHRLDAPARRMKSLVDDLLTLARLESSPTPELSTLSEIDGKSLISTIIEELQPLAKPNHRIVVEAQPKLSVRGIQIELHSAFLNLATNALRYSPDGGTVTIKWCQHDGQVRFSVQDEGVGIAPQHIPRITERFYRVDPISSQRTGGTGLGLAIVKHVLKRHQSALQITSNLGQGSTFYCDLPFGQVQEADCVHDTI